MADTSILFPHGGYHKLLTYKKSNIIYEGTLLFCKRFLRLSDRTVDQMVQGARSCKQNITEGSSNSGISKSNELYLTGIARGSLAELLEDYKDQIISRNLQFWDIDSEKVVKTRAFCKKHMAWSDYQNLFETRDVESLCNLQICLINQTCFLLDQQIRSLEKDLIAKGGIKERITTLRREYKGKDWEDQIYNYLMAANTVAEVNRREQEILRGVARCKAQATQKIVRKK